MTIDVEGNAGYFLGGLAAPNREAVPTSRSTVRRLVVGENLMGGTIRVCGQRLAERRLERAGRPHLH